MKKIFLSLLILNFILTACTAAIQTPVVNHKTPLYETAKDAQDRINAENAAIEIISAQYDYDPAKILILKSSSKTWSDSCLEVAPTSEVCTPDSIPGYLILSYVDQTIFEVHVDLSGERVYALNYLTNYFSPADVAVLLLAKQLAVSVNDVLFQSIEQVDWTDSCLDIVNEEAVCIPIMTPGYRIKLEALGTIYEFHTDTFGTRMIRVY